MKKQEDKEIFFDDEGFNFDGFCNDQKNIERKKLKLSKGRTWEKMIS